MTKRYPLGGAFRGPNPCNTSNFQRIALGIPQATNVARSCRLHFDKTLCLGRPRGDGVGRHNDHSCPWRTLGTGKFFCPRLSSLTSPLLGELYPAIFPWLLTPTFKEPS